MCLLEAIKDLTPNWLPLLLKPSKLSPKNVVNVADCCKLWSKRGQVFWPVLRAYCCILLMKTELKCIFAYCPLRAYTYLSVKLVPTENLDNSRDNGIY